MWYVIDKDYDIVVSSTSTRAQAYSAAKNIKFLYPERKFKVTRTVFARV